MDDFDQADRDYVYRVLYRLVGPDAADDVTQDALVLAIRFRSAFRGDARFSTWLYRVAITAGLGHLRRLRRCREVLAGEHAPEPADPARSPEALLADLQAAEHDVAVLAHLAPKYREVVILRALLSEVDTAARLGISVANVKVRAHRARRILREVDNRPSATSDSSCLRPRS